MKRLVYIFIILLAVTSCALAQSSVDGTFIPPSLSISDNTTPAKVYTLVGSNIYIDGIQFTYYDTDDSLAWGKDANNISALFKHDTGNNHWYEFNPVGAVWSDVGLVLPFNPVATPPANALNPLTVTFSASLDHNLNTSAGVALVTSYEIAVLNQATSILAATPTNIGKPIPDLNNNITVPVPENGLSNLTNYVIKVSVIGPGGQTASPLSNIFSFDNIATTIPFPAAPGTPVVR